MEKEEMVSLANLGRGACIEQFDEEFGHVLENILDPNTPATVERKIILEVKVKPNDKRDFAVVTVSCSSKLTPARAFQTQIFMGRGVNGYQATEHNSKQPSIFDHLEKVKEGGGEE